jgi:hypothetical protein
MELHPLCTYFPRMSDDEFNSLKDNLQNNGQTLKTLLGNIKRIMILEPFE